MKKKLYPLPKIVSLSTENGELEYHTGFCERVQKGADSSKISPRFFETTQEAEKLGIKPCISCASASWFDANLVNLKCPICKIPVDGKPNFLGNFLRFKCSYCGENSDLFDYYLPPTKRAESDLPENWELNWKKGETRLFSKELENPGKKTHRQRRKMSGFFLFVQLGAGVLGSLKGFNLGDSYGDTVTMGNIFIILWLMTELLGLFFMIPNRQLENREFPIFRDIPDIRVGENKICLNHQKTSFYHHTILELLFKYFDNTATFKNQTNLLGSFTFSDILDVFIRKETEQFFGKKIELFKVKVQFKSGEIYKVFQTDRKIEAIYLEHFLDNFLFGQKSHTRISGEINPPETAKILLKKDSPSNSQIKELGIKSIDTPLKNFQKKQNNLGGELDNIVTRCKNCSGEIGRFDRTDSGFFHCPFCNSYFIEFEIQFPNLSTVPCPSPNCQFQEEWLGFVFKRRDENEIALLLKIRTTIGLFLFLTTLEVLFKLVPIFFIETYLIFLVVFSFLVGSIPVTLPIPIPEGIFWCFFQESKRLVLRNGILYHSESRRSESRKIINLEDINFFFVKSIPLIDKGNLLMKGNFIPGDLDDPVVQPIKGKNDVRGLLQLKRVVIFAKNKQKKNIPLYEVWSEEEAFFLVQELEKALHNQPGKG